MTDKLCKNCNWHKDNDYYGTNTGVYDECLCPDIPKIKDLVNGREINRGCIPARCNEDLCGKDGKFWMKK